MYSGEERKFEICALCVGMNGTLNTLSDVVCVLCWYLWFTFGNPLGLRDVDPGM